jgi:glutathione reductase (NADPH)
MGSSAEEYDLVTLGAGSGGTRASRFAAQYYNAKVAIVELPFGFVSSDDVGGRCVGGERPLALPAAPQRMHDCLAGWWCAAAAGKADHRPPAAALRAAPHAATGAGGTCVIRGCVPKKLLVYAAQFNEEFHDAQGFGWLAQRPGHEWKSASGRVHGVAWLPRCQQSLVCRASSCQHNTTAVTPCASCPPPPPHASQR